MFGISKLTCVAESIREELHLMRKQCGPDSITPADKALLDSLLIRTRKTARRVHTLAHRLEALDNTTGRA